MSLGVYPDFVKIEPQLTRELLYGIAAKCKAGETLDDEERAFLCDAIDRLGRGLPPAKAFYLTAKQGKRSTLARDTYLYNRVVIHVNTGLSLEAACLKVSLEPDSIVRPEPSGTTFGGPLRTRHMSEKAIEAAVRRVAKAVKTPVPGPKKLGRAK
jgi:hypothetical protein